MEREPFGKSREAVSPASDLYGFRDKEKPYYKINREGVYNVWEKIDREETISLGGVLSLPIPESHFTDTNKGNN